MAGEFEDLVPKTAGTFDDLIPNVKGTFDDLLPMKPRLPISTPGISTITGKPTTGFESIPPVNVEPLSGLRPLEFLYSPLTAGRASFMAGMKKKIEGASLAEQAEEMLTWFGAGLGEWARPIGEAPISPTLSSITGHTGALGLIENVLGDPTLPFMGSTVPGIAKKIAGTQKLGEMQNILRGTKIGNITAERTITPTFRAGGGLAPAAAELPNVIEGIGITKNLPAVIPQPKIVPKPTDELARLVTSGIERKPKVIPVESLMGKSHAEWKLGKKELKVTLSRNGEEQIFRLSDKSGKEVFVEMGLKEHPQQNALELAWLNIDKNGIDLAARRTEKIGKPTQTIPGLYKEIHKKLELYARDKGYGTIGTNPTTVGKDRLKILGFQDVADDLMGDVPYSMYKRVGQNVNFEHPDFWGKYRNLKIFEKTGEFGQTKAKEIYEGATLRNMSFDLTSDGKWTFYDRYLQPIQKFKTLDEAEAFMKSVRLSDKNYLMKAKRINDAEKLYNLAAEGYTQKTILEASKETASYYKAAAGIKERTTLETYRKFITPETTQKIAMGGEGIKQKIVAAATDDARAVFDIGVGETVGISKNVPIKESYLTTLSKIKDTPKDFYQRVLTGRGWLMPALHFFERQGNDVKEMFYRRIKVAEKREAQSIRNLENEVFGLQKELGLGKKEFNRIGDFLISQDPIGKATLERGMKKIVPTWDDLSPNEQKFYEFIRTKYEEYFNRINEARAFAGIDPIDYRGDYFTFFRNYDELEKLGYHLNSPQFAAKYEDFIHKNATTFVHEKLRKGGFIPLEENSRDVFLRYARSAEHHIHMTPPIAINRALIAKFKVGEKVFDIQSKAPSFHAWVERWLDDIAGQRANTELPQWMERAANKLNQNITYSFLSYNIRSALIQPTAIVNSFIELGPKYLMEGMYDWITGANNAIKKSNVLLTREYEQSVAEAYKMVREPGYFTKFVEEITGQVHPTMRGISRGFQGGKQAVARTGMKPLQFLDMQTAQITWNGAYKKAKNYLKMGEEEAINYADDMVTRTQGSGKISDLSQAQRGPVGKTLLLLQTFVNNNWSFLMRDVFGFSNPALKNKERFEKVMKLLIGITATNIVFEDILGTYSPFPTPVRAYIEGREGGSSIPGAVVKSVKELAELVPGIGGAIRYGSHPGGPLMETMGSIPQILQGRPAVKSPEQLLGTLLGVPGVSQAKKVGVGRKRGAGLIELILGMKNAQEKTKKGKLEIQDLAGFGELGLD